MPAHNQDAEKAIIGVLIANPELFPIVRDRLTPEDFFPGSATSANNRLVFESLAALVAEKKAVDAITVGARAKLPAGYVERYTTVACSTENLDGYIEVVRQATFWRKTDEAKVRLQQALEQREKDAAVVLDEAAEILRYLQSFNPAAAVLDVDSVQRVGAEYLAYVQENKDIALEDRITTTGLPDLDRALGGGLYKQDLTIVAARPGMGKTSMSGGIIRHNLFVRSGEPSAKRVGLVTTEMGKIQSMNRMISYETGVSTESLRSLSVFNSDEAGVVYAEVGRLMRTNLFITTNRVFEHFRPWISSIKPDLVVVDYLQQMWLLRTQSNRVQEISIISDGLKGAAVDEETAVLANSQLSRAVEQRQDKRPQLSDLRESGSIEQDADTVIFLYRGAYYDPEKADPNLAEADVAKNRNGPTGTVDLYWDGPRFRFASLKKEGPLW